MKIRLLEYCPKFALCTFLLIALPACSQLMGDSELIDITLCARGFDNVVPGDQCPPEFVVRKMRIPRNLTHSIPRGNTSFTAGEVNLFFYKADILAKYSPFLAERKKKYSAIGEWIWIRPNEIETVDQMVARSASIGGSFYKELYPTVEAMRLRQQWTVEQGFKIRRAMPASEAQANRNGIYPTDLLPLDGTKLYARCANDPTLGVPAGCHIYNYVSPNLRVDYSDVVLTPELMLETSQEIFKLIDHFTVYPQKS